MLIGPNCRPNNDIDEDTFYFFDNLVLAEQSAFEFSITVNGAPCNNDFYLRGPERDSLSYQWYLDGVALLEEQSSQIAPNGREGRFELRLTGA